MNGDIVISVVGLSYKSASVKDLEEFQLPRKHSDKFLQLFASQVGIEGVVFLSTCNRNEIYFTHHKSIKPKDYVLNFNQEFLEKIQKAKENCFIIIQDAKPSHIYFGWFRGWILWFWVNIRYKGR
jgi:glutamyl-tRNA reductase